MTNFVAAPPVPRNYPKLDALTAEEVVEAQRYGYVADDVDPSAPVSRTCSDPLLYTKQMCDQGNDIRAWRARMYIVWFCYVFENLRTIQRPLYAVEELFLHFQSNILDDLAQLYAGAGAWEDSPQELDRLTPHLRRYYDLAIRLLAPFT